MTDRTVGPFGRSDRRTARVGGRRIMMVDRLSTLSRPDSNLNAATSRAARAAGLPVAPGPDDSDRVCSERVRRSVEPRIMKSAAGTGPRSPAPAGQDRLVTVTVGRRDGHRVGQTNFGIMMARASSPLARMLDKSRPRGRQMELDIDNVKSDGQESAAGPQGRPMP